MYFFNNVFFKIVDLSLEVKVFVQIRNLKDAIFLYICTIDFNSLLILDNSYLVHCGHGPDTSIGHERETNPFLNA